MSRIGSITLGQMDRGMIAWRSNRKLEDGYGIHFDFKNLVHTSSSFEETATPSSSSSSSSSQGNSSRRNNTTSCGSGIGSNDPPSPRIAPPNGHLSTLPAPAIFTSPALKNRHDKDDNLHNVLHLPEPTPTKLFPITSPRPPQSPSVVVDGSVKLGTAAESPSVKAKAAATTTTSAVAKPGLIDYLGERLSATYDENVPTTMATMMMMMLSQGTNQDADGDEDEPIIDADTTTANKASSKTKTLLRTQSAHNTAKAVPMTRAQSWQSQPQASANMAGGPSSSRPSSSRRGSFDIAAWMKSKQLALQRFEIRERRMQIAKANRHQTIQDEERAVREAVEKKLQRDALRRAAREADLRRQFWAKALVLMSFHEGVRQQVPQLVREQWDLYHREAMVEKIAKWFLARRRIRRAKQELRFLRSMKVFKPFLRIYAARWQRRASAGMVRHFLEASIQLPRFAFRIRHNAIAVLQKVRLLQRNVRGYLMCQRARLELLSLYWEAIEFNFIKNMVNSAINRRNKGLLDENSVSSSMAKWLTKRRRNTVPGPLMKPPQEDMRDQLRISRWSNLELDIDKFVLKHDPKISESQIVRSYMVDAAVRVPHLRRALDHARRDCLDAYNASLFCQFEELLVVPDFTTDDVRQLLRGDHDRVLGVLRHKLEVGARRQRRGQFSSHCMAKAKQAVRLGGFLLFKHLNRPELERSVKRVHENLKTQYDRRVVLSDGNNAAACPK